MELPGAAGSASYPESQGKPGNFGQVSATGNSQPPAESWWGGGERGSAPDEVARPDPAGSLSAMTIVLQKPHSRIPTDIIYLFTPIFETRGDPTCRFPQSDTGPSELLRLRSASSDQSPPPHPRPRPMTSSSGREADSHANYCLLSTPPSGGLEKGGS